MEVLEDTLEEGNVDVGIRKTDTVTVSLRYDKTNLRRLTSPKYYESAPF
jgi:hypothetical protein